MGISDWHKYNLEREGLHELSSELRRLFALGYRWSHGYTQCRLQAMLYAFKHELTFEPDTCSHLSDNDLEGALKALEGQVELDPQEVAIIKYTPSVDDPHASYADEVFYPPLSSRPQEDMRQKILAPHAIDLDMPDSYANYVKRAWIPQMRRRSLPFYPEIPPDDFRRTNPIEALEFLQEYENDQPQLNYPPESLDNNALTLEEMKKMYPLIKFFNDMHLTPREIQKLLSPENNLRLMDLLDNFDNIRPEDEAQELLRKHLNERLELENKPNVKFMESYTPDDFRTTWDSSNDHDFPETRVYYDENDEDNSEYGSGHLVDEISRERNNGEGIFRERQNGEDNFRERHIDEGIFGDRKPHEDDNVPAGRGIFGKLNQGSKYEEKIIRPAVYSEGGVVWPAPIEQNVKGEK